ncbi:MAG: 6-pyruvoyl-tetrahydropterin synthase-related protein [Patescibacteria group bacterium]
MKKLLIFIAIGSIVLFLGKNLLPGNTMFDFHDETQPARIAEFSFDLAHGQIPPRIAPHFSFNLGYPVFNYYAPFSYWTTSLIHIIGFDIADSLKLSFLIAYIVGFMGMYFFLRNFLKDLPSLFAASLFISSPYFALDTFIRGNLAEIWLIVLIPWVLYFLYKNSNTDSPYFFAGTALITSFAISAHNVLSLIFLPVMIIFIFLHKHPKKNIIAMGLGLALASYYLIPAVLENSLTNAGEIAKRTNYMHHFLCIKQVWTGVWGYGGSLPGCDNDGMSYMLGKIQLLVSAGGAIYLLFTVLRKGMKELRVFILILLLTVMSIFMSTYQSAFIWKIFEPILSLFQFPWRFLAFATFGNAVLGGYLVSRFKNPVFSVFLVILIILPITYNAKFFTKYQHTKSEFNSNYLSKKYLETGVVYKIAEYLPKTVNFNEWWSYNPQPDGSEKKDNNVSKGPIVALDAKPNKLSINYEYKKQSQTTSQKILLNVHYFPYWKILVDDKQIVPDTFDKLGRPILQFKNSQNRNISLQFRQTNIEIFGNVITVLAFLLIGLLTLNSSLWKRMQRMLN